MENVPPRIWTQGPFTITEYGPPGPLGPFTITEYGPLYISMVLKMFNYFREVYDPYKLHKISEMEPVLFSSCGKLNFILQLSYFLLIATPSPPGSGPDIGEIVSVKPLYTGYLAAT